MRLFLLWTNEVSSKFRKPVCCMMSHCQHWDTCYTCFWNNMHVSVNSFTMDLMQWSNELDEVFWVTFVLQEEQNVTGGWQEGNLPWVQLSKMLTTYIVFHNLWITIQEVAGIVRVAHCFIALGLLKLFMGLCCNFQSLTQNLMFALCLSLRSLLKMQRCLCMLLQKKQKQNAYNTGPDLDSATSHGILTHDSFCSLLLHIHDRTALHWFTPVLCGNRTSYWTKRKK